jgi:hypothetical protein
MINEADHGVWRANFGSSVPAIAAAAVSNGADHPSMALTAARAIDAISVSTAPQLLTSSATSPRRSPGTLPTTMAALPVTAAGRDAALMAWLSQSQRQRRVQQETTSTISDDQADESPPASRWLDEAFLGGGKGEF